MFQITYSNHFYFHFSPNYVYICFFGIPAQDEGPGKKLKPAIIEWQQKLDKKKTDFGPEMGEVMR